MTGTTIVGDALDLPFPDESFDAVVTSPSYGNRMADHHIARDASYRRTYTHSAKHPAPFSKELLPQMERLLRDANCGPDLLDPFAGVGRVHSLPFNTVGVEIEPAWAAGGLRDTSEPLKANNTGVMRWGDEYRLFHVMAWLETLRVLKPNGLFLLNIKDHFRADKQQHVARWHIHTLIELGLRCETIREVDTPGFRFGANRTRCVEKLILFRKLERTQ